MSVVEEIADGQKGSRILVVFGSDWVYVPRKLERVLVWAVHCCGSVEGAISTGTGFVVQTAILPSHHLLAHRIVQLRCWRQQIYALKDQKSVGVAEAMQDIG